MPAIPALIVAGGTLAAGAIGANAQSRAARSAANAQAGAAADATGLQREIYYDQRALLAPQIQSGAGARARQMLMQGFSPEEVRGFLQDTTGALSGGGAGGGQSVASIEDLQQRYPDLYAQWTDPGTDGFAGNMQGTPNFADWVARAGGDIYAAPQQSGDDPNAWVDNWSYEASSPSYGFRLGEGTRALERSAAARGRLFSGATGMALQRYGQDFASQEFENDFRRLGALSGSGEQAAGVVVNAAGQYGANAGNNMMAAGNARASGYLGQGNAWGNFWGNSVPGAIGTVAGYGGWGVNPRGG